MQFAICNSHSRLKSLTIAGMFASAALVCRWQRLDVPVDDLWPPAALVAGLLVLAAYYRGRGETVFVLCLSALAQIVAFALCFVVLMYAVATFSRPLVDQQLAAFDAWCGVQTPALRDWAGAHPAIERLLRFAYDTLLYQTAAVVALLGLQGDRRRLESFVLAFMLVAVMTLALFVALPAAGPFVYYGFPASVDQARFLAHFESLRDGSLTTIRCRAAEGLITFPSFHVAWAVLLTWAYRGRRRLFAAFALLNALVIVSTMTTGWHYFADVLGGLAAAAAGIGISGRVGIANFKLQIANCKLSESPYFSRVASPLAIDN